MAKKNSITGDGGAYLLQYATPDNYKTSLENHVLNFGYFLWCLSKGDDYEADLQHASPFKLDIKSAKSIQMRIGEIMRILSEAKVLLPNDDTPRDPDAATKASTDTEFRVFLDNLLAMKKRG